MNIVIVESPAKAKTINKYLGSQYKVFASFGHIRDLSPKEGSVEIAQDFAMNWELSPGANKRLSAISKELKNSEKLILATDPDREGEAISWHVLEVLKEKAALNNKAIERVVFNAVTKNAILAALESPRKLDENLINAYLARRALDYLFGFNLSPILWRKLPGARSAGRVQSVALRLLCQREEEIEQFIAQDFWTIIAEFLIADRGSFSAKLVEFNKQKIEKFTIQSKEQAQKIQQILEQAVFSIAAIESKATQRHPQPPFTTSTLQQAASAKLGFSPSKTMQISQALYEGVSLQAETTGLITYMRTDAVQMAPEGINEARNVIKQIFGPQYCPDKARFYANKTKNAQEAHEAIRPTSFQRLPREVKNYLSPDQFKLYDLIWKRAMASQMSSAQIERTQVTIEAQKDAITAMLRATGSVVKFPGFLELYQDSDNSDKNGKEQNAPHNEDDKPLVAVKKEDKIELDNILIEDHRTEPPPRYSEASLIKKMEELGIGRPSTYASTIATLKDRGYSELNQRRLIPAPKGRIVIAFLEHFFERYVEYNFTADLEENLDLISSGKINWKELLQNFWQNFNQAIEGIKDLRIAQILDHLNDSLAPFLFPPKNPDKDPRSCPQCAIGQLSLKLGRYGAFIGCSNYPSCNYVQMLGHNNDRPESEAIVNSTILGYGLNEDMPLSAEGNEQEAVSVKNGRFGPYVQYGDGKTAKRCAIPKDWDANNITLEQARKLINLPLVIGLHPETKEEITAHIGRYGPYISYQGKSRSVASSDKLFAMDVNEAAALLEQPASKRKAGATSASSNKKIIGQHPDGGDITLQSGRFGPYVKWKSINASIPKSYDIDNISLDDALMLIARKEAKSPKKPSRKK